jgi:hypothetical protein
MPQSVSSADRVRRIWRDHSLTIILSIVALGSTVIAVSFVWPLSPDRWFDLFSGIGAGFLTIAGFNWLSGPFRERNKPET